jgi:plasmid stabilization system protein ParE
MPEKSSRLSWTPKAGQDLLDIWHYYYSEASDEIADKVVGDIIADKVVGDIVAAAQRVRQATDVRSSAR